MRDRPPSTSGGGELRVEIADLRGYVDVVDDLGGYLRMMSAHAETHCSRTDFGPLLDPMSVQYAALLPQIHATLETQATRMRSCAVVLDQTLTDYLNTDENEAQRHGGAGLAISDDGKSSSYYGDPLTEFMSPAPTESELPEIDLGFPFDQLAWALDKICNYDVRRELTDVLVGDVVEISKQANAWHSVSSGASSYANALSNANSIVARTWEGQAASTTQVAMGLWTTALEEQQQSFSDIAKHLEDVAEDAVEMAQLAVDMVKLALDLIASAWASQWIPIYGQAKFAGKAWDAFTLVKSAWDKLQQFLDVLGVIMGALEILHDAFNPVNLPSEPLGA